MKNKYWSDREIELCTQWVSATTQADQSRVYRELYPKVKQMAESILNRYFTFNRNEEEEYVEHCIQHGFMGLYKYNITKKGKNGWYSYIQTVMKNFYHETLFTRKTLPKDILNHKDKVSSIDVQESEYSNLPYTSQSIANDIEELKQDALEKLQEFKENIENEYMLVDEKFERKGEEMSSFLRLKYENEITFLDLTIEFIREHDSYDYVALGIYIHDNARSKDMSDSFITHSIKKYFGVWFISFYDGHRDNGEKYNRKKDEYSYIQDDYVYKTTVYRSGSRKPVQKDRRRKMLKNEEINKYLYF